MDGTNFFTFILITREKLFQPYFYLCGRLKISDLTAATFSSGFDKRVEQVMDSFVGKTLIDRNGDRYKAVDILRNKLTYILLFASSECKGIEELLDTLKAVYNESFKHRCGFEVVLISSDTTVGSFNHFFQNMNGPWYALPYEEQITVESHSIEIRGRFGVKFIPFIVVVKPDGTLVSQNAIEELMTLGINVIVAWTD